MPFWAPAEGKRPVSGVALTLLSIFFALVFPYSSGLEIPRPGVQIFYACLGPVYLDLAMSRWHAPRSGLAGWLMALFVQAVALVAVRLKVSHWVWPGAAFLLGAAMLGLGVAVAGSYMGEFWNGSLVRQVYLFGALALFLFWRMLAPDVLQEPVDALLLPDAMPVAGLIGGSAVAALGWFVYGREHAA